MIIVKIFKDNAENFKGITVANEWKELIKQIRFYFSDHKEVKERILSGEVVNLPYFTLQKDRREKVEGVTNERRDHHKKVTVLK